MTSARCELQALLPHTCCRSHTSRGLPPFRPEGAERIGVKWGFRGTHGRENLLATMPVRSSALPVCLRGRLPHLTPTLSAPRGGGGVCPRCANAIAHRCGRGVEGA